jgi:hypothetical protein
LGLRKDYEVGDWVVFRKQKRGVAPSPRAKNVRPAQHGDDYGYEIEKYWCVCGKLAGNRIEVVTRRGKRHVVECADPRLRLANWLERWFLAARFPRPTPRPSETGHE